MRAVPAALAGAMISLLQLFRCFVGGVLREAPVRRAHCALIPAWLMTFPHFAISIWKRAAASSGVLATGS